MVKLYRSLSLLLVALVPLTAMAASSSSSQANDTIVATTTPPIVVAQTPLPTTPAPMSLTTIPTVLNDGDNLNVYWSGVVNATSKDFIAFTCGEHQGMDDALVKTKGVHINSTVEYHLLSMMRCDYEVAYYQFQSANNVSNASQGSFVELARVTIPMKDSFNLPKQGHLALTENPDEMVVMFNSASDKTPQVKFGKTKTCRENVVSGTTTTYTNTDMCSAPATTVAQDKYLPPGNMHKVILKKLARGQRYYYQYGNDEDGWSPVATFQTQPKANVKNPKVKFIAFGDMGVEGGPGMGTWGTPSSRATSQRVTEDVTTKGFDHFLLHFGDLSYARGKAHFWDEFMYLVQPFATKVPYMVGVGNHEYDYKEGGAKDPSGGANSTGQMTFHPNWANYGNDGGGECGVTLVKRFHVPNTGNGPFWYSFDYSNVHVVQMSTEHDWFRGSTQYKWLENDLKRVNRKKTPWIVLTLHRVMYSTQNMVPDRHVVATYLRQELEQLFNDYKVNLVLAGHQHSYERSCGMVNGTCDAKGHAPMYANIGSAGAEITNQTWSSERGNWSASRNNDYGYMRLTATNKQIDLEFVLNSNGTVYDKATVVPWY